MRLRNVRGITHTHTQKIFRERLVHTHTERESLMRTFREKRGEKLGGSIHTLRNQHRRSRLKSKQWAEQSHRRSSHLKRVRVRPFVVDAPQAFCPPLLRVAPRRRGSLARIGDERPEDGPTCLGCKLGVGLKREAVRSVVGGRGGGDASARDCGAGGCRRAEDGERVRRVRRAATEQSGARGAAA